MSTNAACILMDKTPSGLELVGSVHLFSSVACFYDFFTVNVGYCDITMVATQCYESCSIKTMPTTALQNCN